MSASKTHDWATYKRLLGCVRPYRGRLVLGFLCSLLYGGSNALMIWVVKGGFREVFDPASGELGGLLLVVAVLFPAVGIARGLSDFLTAYYFRWVGHRVVMDLRNAMFTHVHELPVAYFSQSRTGELVSRTTNDTMLVERAVSTVIADLAKQPFTLIGMVVWVFLVDARLAAVSLIVFPVCVIPIAIFGRRIRRHSREAQERIADFVSILQESVAGVRIVKAFGMEPYEIERFRRQTRSFFGRIMRVAKANAIVEPIIVLIATVGIGLVLVYVRLVHMSLDNFVAFVAALLMMYEPVKKLSRIHLAVQQSSAAADRIFEVLDTECTVVDRPGAIAFDEEVAEIVLDRVSFDYGDGPVLTDISLRVKAGERIAFVGGSGAGKTTLVNLLPRFFDVTAGGILLNGSDIRDLTLESLRSCIGLVTQETFLFNESVADNISYGSVASSRREIEEAARRAHAHDFIGEMPDGYATIIGERGVRLSGGQRQRLAIARAILRNPPILILDEATSALDTESERMVQAALDEVMVGRTVFAIAHRLSTITNCDRIVVLDRGCVAEEGPHGELISLGGIYKRLHDLQFEK